jgi:hypothetical protein
MVDIAGGYPIEARRAVAVAYRTARQQGLGEHKAHLAARAAYEAHTGDGEGASQAAVWIVKWVSVEHPKWLWQNVRG